MVVSPSEAAERRKGILTPWSVGFAEARRRKRSAAAVPQASHSIPGRGFSILGA